MVSRSGGSPSGSPGYQRICPINLFDTPLWIFAEAYSFGCLHTHHLSLLRNTLRLPLQF